MPLFVDVASIVAGYTLETEVEAGAVFPSRSGAAGDTFSASGSGRFVDRPTITYVPISGQQFNRSFMTPIPPQAVLFLIQSGWAAELVMPIVVDSINGMRSRVAAGVAQREGDQDFYRAIELFDELQRSGAVGMRVQLDGGQETTLIVFHQKGLTPDVRESLSELGALLGIDAEDSQIRVTYSQIAGGPGELAMLTRSMLQIMVNMATHVDVPEDDVLEGRTMPTLSSEGDDARVLRIRSSRQRPSDAFVAVRYRDNWFYIDDRDFKSKRSFGFLMILFSLSETGARESLPLVTIPSG
jgi:hypothetical protein